MDAATAQKNWEFENDVERLSEFDALYRSDPEKEKALRASKPWKKDVNYFKSCRISTIALLKMVTHARSGGEIEVMGMLQGKVMENTLVIMDCYALPVEGTETRVNAMNEANEYMVQYSLMSNEIGRVENIIGWYHSHPGYGCWLSGIDCTTQSLNQQYQDPYLAVVVDPVRTMAAGKVEIGAFRTYPKDHRPANDQQSQYQPIPLEKIEDFGVHAKEYYSLETTFFKSAMDTHLLSLLWKKYWINTLSSSPLLANRTYTLGAVKDITQKVESAENQLTHSQRMSLGFFSGDKEGQQETKLSKLNKDSSKTAVEALQNLMSEVIKDSLFNQRKK
jgi:COP9 signalosome complex subunit 5